MLAAGEIRPFRELLQVPHGGASWGGEGGVSVWGGRVVVCVYVQPYLGLLTCMCSQQPFQTICSQQGDSADGAT